MQPKWIYVTDDVRYIDRTKADMGKIDCFFKFKEYEWEKEWRICFFRNTKDTNAYELDVGDLSDIVDIIESSQVNNYLMKKYYPCVGADVLPQYGESVGNMSRIQLRKKMCEYE